MQYLITFLEGFSAFISPCMLPMLPVYISYFTGDEGTGSRRRTLLNACFFVVGFSVVYMLLGVFAGSLGAFLSDYKVYVNVFSGVAVIFFGLGFLGVFKLVFLKGMSGARKIKSVFSSFVFGIVFSVSITPCVGAFLGSALMLASSQGGWEQGLLLLFVYALGMGIPFILSAVLISSLKNAFDFIKKHYKTINIICGVFLILTGISMAFGWFNNLLSFFGG